MNNTCGLAGGDSDEQHEQHARAMIISDIDTTMSINRETIDKIASLARLSFTEEEKDVFVEQFQRIVEYVDVIQSLDLDGVEPLKHIGIGTENVFRDDVAQPCIPLEDALQNAPKRNESFFKVPRVLG